MDDLSPHTVPRIDMTATDSNSRKRVARSVGFIGLGIMGLPMAQNLLKAGHVLFANSRSGVPSDILQMGAIACTSPAQVAERADIVFMMLPDTPDVERVLFSNNGVASGLSIGKTVVDMSSISPIATKQFASRIDVLGCAYLDAPVSGGEIGARNATLTIMVGGNEKVFDEVSTLFRCLGKNISLVGSNGAGQTAKVANQIIVALTIEAVAEALMYTARSGVDPSKVREALMGGFASSRVLEVHGERMIKRQFAPGFRMKLHRKDLDIALSTAKQMSLSLPNTSMTQQLFDACSAVHGGDLDHSAIVQALEEMAKFKLMDCASV
jgi:2-hydroxy-3-oxopropionate reductase